LANFNLQMRIGTTFLRYLTWAEWDLWFLAVEEELIFSTQPRRIPVQLPDDSDHVSVSYNYRGLINDHRVKLLVTHFWYGIDTEKQCRLFPLLRRLCIKPIRASSVAFRFWFFFFSPVAFSHPFVLEPSSPSSLGFI
jgi:hypothetical protein